MKVEIKNLRVGDYFASCKLVWMVIGWMYELPVGDRFVIETRHDTPNIVAVAVFSPQLSRLSWFSSDVLVTPITSKTKI